MVDRHCKYRFKNRYKIAVGVAMIWIYCVCTPSLIIGQIKVSVSNGLDRSPEALVRDVLLGNGVEVLSVRTIGSQKSIGKFDNALKDIGINSGIALSTGSVSSIPRPNDRKDTGDSPDPDAIQTDSDLQSLTSYPIKEVTGLEIEFRSQTEFLEFRYVFASEEYPEFTCSKFNDIFAFLVTGPKPGGGFYDKENIALVPDPNDPSGDTFTNYPVWTNTVNNGEVGDIPSDGNCTDPNESLAFTQYYNDNSNSTTFTFDGFLDIFKSKVRVVPCQVYKIKLIIGDSNDFDYDSAVFLEANSLKSRAYTYFLEPASRNLREGCQIGRIGIKYSAPTSEALEVPLKLLSVANSDAQKGIDYDLSSESFSFSPGDSVAFININILEDNEMEAPEFIRIIDELNGCAIDTITLTISDNRIETMLAEVDDQSLCPDGATLSSIFGELSSAIFDFQSNTSNYSIAEGYDKIASIPITVSGMNNLSVQMPISDICLSGLSHPKLSELSILLKSPWGQVIRIADHGQFNESATNYDICLSDKLNLDSVTNKFNSEQSVNGTWELIVVDEFMNSNRGSLSGWSLAFQNLEYLDLTIKDSANQVLDWNTIIRNDTKIEIEATDNYGCQVSKSINISVLEDNSQTVAVSCQVMDRDRIKFEWIYLEDVNFEIKTGTDWIDIGKKTFYEIKDLQPDQVVEFNVRPILGNCMGQASKVICNTPSCIVPDINIVAIGQSSNACSPNGYFEFSSITTKGPYTYFIDDKEINAERIEGLAQGTYMVDLIDGYGCKASAEVVIKGVSSMTVSATIESALCGQQGFIDIFVSGGMPPYTYLWSTGSTEKEANGLQGGTYTITVTDAQDCQLLESYELTQTERLKVTNPVVRNASCYGMSDGQVELSISGGLPPYSVAVINKEDLTLHDTNKLSAGEYVLRVKDDNECIVETNVRITQPEKISITTDVISSTCSYANDGIIQLNIAGGNEPYDILWEDNDVSDVRRHLSAGTYSVSVTDNKSCTISSGIELTALEEPKLSIEKKNSSCFGVEDGSIEIDISNMEFDVNWSDGNDNKTRNFLKPDQYCGIIETESGCTIDTCILLTQPQELSVELDINNNKCFGNNDGEIAVRVLDGQAPYELTLGELRATNDSIFKIEELAVGQYNLVLKEASGCEKNMQFSIASAPIVEKTLTSKDISCYAGNDGSLELNYSGLKEPVLIQWIGPSNFSSDAFLINELNAGTYTYAISDGNACEYSEDIILSQPDQPLIADVAVNDISCYGNNDGIIMASLSGGSGQYSFSINDGGNYRPNGLFEGLGPGSYDIYARDELKCVIEIPDIIVVEPMKFIINLEVDTEVFDTQDVPIEVSALHAQGDYILSWVSDPADDLPCTNCNKTLIENIQRNLFLAVNAIDESGCRAYDEKKIYVRRANHIDVPSAFTPNNDKNNDQLYVYGTIDAQILDFAIFNRDGMPLFNSSGFKANEKDIGWDGIYKGSMMPAGTYIWAVTARFPDDAQMKFTGVTQLIR